MSSVEKSRERKRKRDRELVNGTSEGVSKKHRHKKQKIPDSNARAALEHPIEPALNGVEDDFGANEQQTWIVSEPVGGKFIDVDPVFTPDEKFLIFATESAVNVYSTADSSLVRTLRAPQTSTLSTYTLSTVNPYILWVGTLEGHILKWDVTIGKLLQSWTIDGSILHLVSSTHPSGQKDHDLLFSITKLPDQQWIVAAHHTETGKSEDETSNFTCILDARKPLSNLKVVEEGQKIVVMTIDSLIVGALFSETGRSRKLRYIWREVTCQEAPVCFDVRARQKEDSTSISKPANSSRKGHDYALDVVVGGVKGCIFAFDDLLDSLGHLEKPSKDVQNSATLNGRSLHWHREAVGAVAWSRDGNYIISGGKETVLVLWQLRTGSKQFLPNLESPIQSIVVSPSGSSYAVHLGDNSMMVLSTSELTPTTYIAGIQTLSYSNIARPRPQLLTVERLGKTAHNPQDYIVSAALHPRVPSRILASVTGFQTSYGSDITTSHACYLQDFNISTSSHESRQAIARTNAISSNLGPEGNRILEPEVNFLQLSHDGLWLATVDEWIMPEQDVKKLSASKDSLASYRESRLRFWSWNAEENSWKLNSRVEDPHLLEEAVNSGIVLGLASNPAEKRFATVGTDSMVRTWTLKSKRAISRRSALTENNASDVSGPALEDTWWTVQYSIPLESSMESDPLTAISPCDALLAYSLDGSCLAVYLHYDHDEDEDSIYFIDTNQGFVRDIKRDTGLNDSRIQGLKFLDRYLICAGISAVAIWDVTTMELRSIVDLPTATPTSLMKTTEDGNQETPPQPKPSQAEVIPQLCLEVDASTSTFAVALASPAVEKPLAESAHPLLNYQTHLLIYSVKNGTEPILDTKLPRLTAALLASNTGKVHASKSKFLGHSQGYVVLDIGAEVRRVTPNSGAHNLRNEILNDAHTEDDLRLEGGPVNGLSNGVSVSPEPEEAVDEAAGALKDINEYIRPPNENMEADNRPVVRMEALASVFDYPTHSMPPIQDLFWNVLSLYVEKPVYSGLTTNSMVEAPRVELETERFDEGDEASSESSSESDSSSDGDDDD